MTSPATNPMPGSRLPLVQVHESDDGTSRVLLDGRLVVAGPIDRRDLGRVLSVLADQHGSVRVELTDRTGRVFVDVLHPPAGTRQPAPPEPDRPCPPEPAAAAAAEPSARPRLVETHGAGFVPGEDVQVAVIVGSSSAGPDGLARGLVDLTALPTPVRGVVLLGAVSGTLSVEYLP